MNFVYDYRVNALSWTQSTQYLFFEKRKKRKERPFVCIYLNGNFLKGFLINTYIYIIWKYKPYCLLTEQIFILDVDEIVDVNCV